MAGSSPSAVADLEAVHAARVADPHDLPVAAQHPGHPGPHVRVDGQRPAGAVPVGEPVHRAPDLDHAGQAGVVAGQVAQVVRGRHQAGRQRGGRRPQADVEPPGGAVRRQIIQEPQLAAALIDDPGAVGGGLPGVSAVVIGVPEQAGTVQPAGVDVRRALVVGQEGQPVTDQHGAGELPREPGQDALEGSTVRRGPQPPRGPAPVPLPVRRVTSPAAVQQGPGRLLQVQVGDRAERQPPRRAAIHRDLVRPALPLEGLGARAEGQHLAAGGPPAHPGQLITPVSKAAGPLAVHPGQVHLGRPIPPAGPGHPVSIAGKPRAGRFGAVRGQAPRPAAVQRRQPHIVLGHEGEQITVKMGKTEVPG